VIGAAILIFVPTTGDYVTPALVGGTQGTMIANLIEVEFNGVGNWPLGAALSLVSMAMVAAIAGLFVAGARATAQKIR
jgi:spermidine/putrescine transport system permease protein